jgi:hypothetical protein
MIVSTTNSLGLQDSYRGSNRSIGSLTGWNLDGAETNR